MDSIEMKRTLELTGYTVRALSNAVGTDGNCSGMIIGYEDTLAESIDKLQGVLNASRATSAIYAAKKETPAVAPVETKPVRRGQFVTFEHRVSGGGRLTYRGVIMKIGRTRALVSFARRSGKVNEQYIPISSLKHA